MRQKEKKEIEENKKKKKYIRNVRKLIKNDNKSNIYFQILLKYFHKERDLIDDLRKERFHVFLSLLEHSIQTIKISPKLSKDILRLLFDYLNEANSIHSKKEVLDLIGKILVHHHIKFPDMEKKIRILFYSNHKSWNYFEDIITINPELQEEEIGNFELALIANEILIRVYQCKDAFKWRLEQLNNK
ncbi:MAG: hypothetical protein B6229_06775 [Spirochaetaceae bacterium 4572_7]|nr:MAG: hypothetical protein B6229_06775 [Spirochaetaceae bacterium 4572_7]